MYTAFPRLTFTYITAVSCLHLLYILSHRGLIPESWGNSAGAWIQTPLKMPRQVPQTKDARGFHTCIACTVSDTQNTHTHVNAENRVHTWHLENKMNKNCFSPAMLHIFVFILPSISHPRSLCLLAAFVYWTVLYCVFSSGLSDAANRPFG